MTRTKPEDPRTGGVLPDRLILGNNSFALISEDGGRYLYAPESCLPSDVCERVGGEIVRRWNSHADLLRERDELAAFVKRTLDGCFCDDGRGFPECARCVEARALIAKIEAKT